MTGHPAPIAGLALLTAALDEVGVDLGSEVDTLATRASQAVDSYLGLRVSVRFARRPVHLTVFVAVTDPTAVRTSLWFAVPDRSGAPACVAVTLLAGRPGAFVDLGADLAHGWGLPCDDVVLDRHLDAWVPPGPVDGLTDEVSVDRAIGVLIGRGLLPGAAHAWLTTTAATARTSVAAAAVDLLATVTA